MSIWLGYTIIIFCCKKIEIPFVLRYTAKLNITKKQTNKQYSGNLFILRRIAKYKIY